jgi:hypothetical protein
MSGGEKLQKRVGSLGNKISAKNTRLRERN